jgi:fluoroacetyl-CoA thioesterase
MTLQPGLSAAFEVEVQDTDTALAVGSGDVEVLATPRVVALAERATVQAVADHLPPGHTSVGTEVLLRHRRATLPGAVVAVSAHLTEVDGSRLTFTVAAHENGTLVADGTVRRMVVERDAFMDRVRRPRG